MEEVEESDDELEGTFRANEGAAAASPKSNAALSSPRAEDKRDRKGTGNGNSHSHSLGAKHSNSNSEEEELTGMKFKSTRRVEDAKKEEAQRLMAEEERRVRV